MGCVPNMRVAPLLTPETITALPRLRPVLETPPPRSLRPNDAGRLWARRHRRPPRAKRAAWASLASARASTCPGLCKRANAGPFSARIPGPFTD
eukprot:6606023-Pyramimonas_sp.AAC.1